MHRRHVVRFTLSCCDESARRALTFIDTGKFAASLSESIAVVLTTEECRTLVGERAVCVCAAPRLLFFRLHNYLASSLDYNRKSFYTEIGKNCDISPLAYIAPNNVRIGKETVIEEFVSIKENVTIGDHCIIRAGSVIGGEGFEQKRDGNSILSVRHLGGVEIGNHVEIQQNNTVDKAIYPWDNTEIGDYCRTDNLVHIAHEVKMKRGVMIAACTCVAGASHWKKGYGLAPASPSSTVLWSEKTDA